MMLFWPGISCAKDVEKACLCSQHWQAEKSDSITPKEEVNEMGQHPVPEVKPKQPLFLWATPRRS